MNLALGGQAVVCSSAPLRYMGHYENSDFGQSGGAFALRRCGSVQQPLKRAPLIRAS